MELTIKDIFVLLWKKKTKLILSAFVGAVIGFIFTYFFVNPIYTATAKMYVFNDTYNTNEYISSSDLTVSKSLVDTYIIIIESYPVLDKVKDEVDDKYKDITSGEILSMIDAGAINGTEAFYVSVKSDDPQKSTDIANAIIKVAPSEIIRVVKAASVEIIEEARMPSGAFWPVKRNAFVTGVAALAVMVIWILLFAALDTTVKNSDVLINNFNISLLGTVPLIKDDRITYKKNRGIKRIIFRKRKFSDEMTQQKIIDDKTSFSVVEAYRMIRTSIMYIPAIGKCKKFVITSALAAEGKTTTAINLSITLAQNNKKILLIDGDMRKPRIEKSLNVAVNSGLSEYLAGLTEEVEIAKTSVENLYVITSGKITPNPSELLASGRLRLLFESLKDNFDYIIIDSPPVNVVTDSLIFSPMVDGYILAVRAEYSDIKDVKKSVILLEQIDASVKGFILNGFIEDNGFYGKYKYYYAKKAGDKYE